MVSYAQIVQRLPPEWRMTMLELAETIEQRMREQLAVRREDFDRLSADVRALTETLASSTTEFRQYRARSEERFERIEAALERLAEAQARTEAQVRALAEAQARTEAEFREYRARSEERFERIEATLEQLIEAQARTEAQVRALAEAQARTEAQVRALAEAQARTEAQVRALAEAQARTEAEFREYRARSEERFERIEATLAQLIEAQVRLEVQVRALTEAQARTEEVLQSLIATQQKFEERLQRLEVRMGRMDGDLLEIRYQERATAYFGRILRRVKVVNTADILDTLEGRLTPDEVEELLNLDLLIRGRPRGMQVEPGPEVWLAVEISALLDTGDVERATRRAALLRKAGYPAVPTVAGRDISAVAETLARREGVIVFQDGQSALWREALAQWESWAMTE